PSPSLPSRCSTCTRRSRAASSSARRPVPPGELSSTTSSSRRASWASTCGARLGRFAASLYVGMTTNARSDTLPAPCCERAGRRDGQEPERAERQGPASVVELRAEGELDDLGASCERHRDRRAPLPLAEIGRAHV